MGKPRDAKVAILPSTTRKGTTLSTSALDSPSVISQLVSPPQASRVGISAESENSSDNFDDASTVLDNTGSLGPFLDATIARSRQIENTETPNENTVTPVNSPETDDLDEDYVELDDDFIDKCNATTSTSNLKKLIAQHAVRYKLSPDPKFATSPINIKDKDYDFSLDLSNISIVEKTPFCGTEKESAVEHMNELSTLSSLFSDDVKMRTYFVAKIFPFSLKDDAKIWKRTPDEAEELLAKISKNHDDWSTPEPTPTPILKKRGMIELNDEDMREAKKSLMEKGIKSEDVKNLPPIEDLCNIIPPSSTIEDPLYPEGHPKIIEQDSQRTKETSSPSKKKKKKHKTVVESSEPVNDPNSISISDAETESGNEHDEDNDNNDTPDKEEIEKEPEKHAKNKKAEQFVFIPFFAFAPIPEQFELFAPCFRRSPPEPRSRRTCAVLLAVVKLSTAPSSCGASSAPLLQAFFGGVRCSPSPALVDGQAFTISSANLSFASPATSDLRARVVLGKLVFRVDTGASQIRMSTEEYLSSSSSGNQENSASDGLSANLARMEIDAGQDQEAGSSSHGSGIDLSKKTRGAWRGSDVSQHEIDWLRRSRRIPEGVSCRLPGDEIEPVLNPGEFVVFLAHFERGFGLPASDFFRQFLNFYQLQPHHLPGNAVFYLSCYASFMEAYIGIRPTRETFARFFSLRINSIQGKEIPKPKPPVQCGSCIIGSRQGSPFFKFSGLESCRLWQTTFFYVKNDGAADLINLPTFNPATPTKANWGYYPSNHIETSRVLRFMEKLKKDSDICSTTSSALSSPAGCFPQRRAHKMSEMYGPGDPTKITGLPLSKADVVLKAKQICQTDMPDNWEWGLLPLSSTNPPTQEAKDRFPRIESDKRGPVRKRPLDKVDPDPYIHWQDLKMGNASRLGNAPPEASDSADDLVILEVHEHATPLQAEVGQEFLDKLAAGSKKNKAPATDAGSSQAPPAKRPRTEVLGGKQSCALALQGLCRFEAGELRRNGQDLASSSFKPGTFWYRQPFCLPSGRRTKCGARGPYNF
ncbi:hypothetical protein QYE76_011784 [Lolium multiflorum]|uniref:Transposase (putative) gypsy type domain-containing protein n=1 Tax=Lolium multiflorum TaxID=4521 RepID=A0AAD8X5M9_LOLMU|nr:hypothetical protein QYE76_011784 [Lolium multiflorum]